MLLHEASIIATKERAEMKMIEFFIVRKIVVDGAGHSITKRRWSATPKAAAFHNQPVRCTALLRHNRERQIVAVAAFVVSLVGVAA